MTKSILLSFCLLLTLAIVAIDGQIDLSKLPSPTQSPDHVKPKKDKQVFTKKCTSVGKSTNTYFMHPIFSSIYSFLTFIILSSHFLLNFLLQYLSHSIYAQSFSLRKSFFYLLFTYIFFKK